MESIYFLTFLLENWPIPVDLNLSFPDLIHKTALGEGIKELGFIPALDCFGGEDFTVGSHGPASIAIKHTA